MWIYIFLNLTNTHILYKSIKRSGRPRKWVHLSFVRKDFIRQRVQRRGGRHNPEMESGEKMKILPHAITERVHCRGSCGCLVLDPASKSFTFKSRNGVLKWGNKPRMASGSARQNVVSICRIANKVTFFMAGMGVEKEAHARAHEDNKLQPPSPLHKMPPAPPLWAKRCHLIPLLLLLRVYCDVLIV